MGLTHSFRTNLNRRLNSFFPSAFSSGWSHFSTIVPSSIPLSVIWCQLSVVGTRITILGTSPYISLSTFLHWHVASVLMLAFRPESETRLSRCPALADTRTNKLQVCHRSAPSCWLPVAASAFCFLRLTACILATFSRDCCSTWVQLSSCLTPAKTCPNTSISEVKKIGAVPCCLLFLNCLTFSSHSCQARRSSCPSKTSLLSSTWRMERWEELLLQLSPYGNNSKWWTQSSQWGVMVLHIPGALICVLAWPSQSIGGLDDTSESCFWRVVALSLDTSILRTTV